MVLLICIYCVQNQIPAIQVCFTPVYHQQELFYVLTFLFQEQVPFMLEAEAKRLLA